MTTKHKICSKCRVDKLLDDFYTNKRTKDECTSECKLCHNIITQKYLQNNKNKIKEYFRKYQVNRRQTDLQFKLCHNLRVRLCLALKRNSKSQHTKDLIGIDFKTFIEWLEFQFEEGMTLDNYGTVWAIDHTIPISSFNLLDENELRKAMNFINLRPMLTRKNISKGNKVNPWLFVFQEVKAQHFMKNNIIKLK